MLCKVDCEFQNSYGISIALQDVFVQENINWIERNNRTFNGAKQVCSESSY